MSDETAFSRELRTIATERRPSLKAIVKAFVLKEDCSAAHTSERSHRNACRPSAVPRTLRSAMSALSLGSSRRRSRSSLSSVSFWFCDLMREMISRPARITRRRRLSPADSQLRPEALELPDRPSSSRQPEPSRASRANRRPVAAAWPAVAEPAPAVEPEARP